MGSHASAVALGSRNIASKVLERVGGNAVVDRRKKEKMRSYWDERARKNAAWYVDTTLTFDDPDMEKFFAAAHATVSFALDSAPVQPPTAQLAVEIGCGLGRMCLSLSERFDRVIGVDVSPEMIERARGLVKSDRISFVVGDGATLPGVEDGSVDVVYAFTVFQHIPSVGVIERYIEEAGRVLRGGGLLVFQWNNTPGALRWRVRRFVLGKLQKFKLGERYERNDPAFLGSRVPFERVRAAVERGGMEVRKTDGLGALFAWVWAVRKA
jgi:SAM-dependent methyltransferase